MKKINPQQRLVAFKEWQIVAQAMVRGEQTVILRKGGISEGRTGFQWLHDRFFLFPSLFHEQINRVKPNPNGSKRTLETLAQVDGRITFDVYIEALSTGLITDWEEVRRLDPFHIWSEATIRERFEWGDKPGISYAVVQPYLLKEPLFLEDRDSFGGCRSWLSLPSVEGSGWGEWFKQAKTVVPNCGRPDWLL
jgi:hypothetical protein